MSILSVSRRTDVPAYFSEWFFQRLAEGEVCVRNPFNARQVTKYLFQSNDIDCIVFWTKNPIPMMKNNYLDRLAGIPFYFQFTLNAYERDVESFVPNKMSLVDAFKTLSRETGGNVVWRYDPIMFTKKYDLNWHKKSFESLCEQLAGYTDRCVISFVDMYGNVATALHQANIFPKQDTMNDMLFLCDFISKTAAKHGMKVFSCAEKIELSNYGIEHSSCIDKGLIEKAAGYPINAHKSNGQRKECGCVESIDIGKYSTCRNGCKYCYACKGTEEHKKNISLYSDDSPFLCDVPLPNDEVNVKKLASLKIEKTEDKFQQLSLFERE